MMTTANCEEQAVKAALVRNWAKAAELNKKILKEKPQNVPALNRLGKAFWEMDKVQEANKIYKKVIKIDPCNPIANKNLKRLSKFKKKPRNNFEEQFFPSEKLFLEEPGKTKLVRLTRLASPTVLAQQDNGDPITLVVKKRLVSVVDNSQNYLGVIPEDLSQRLIRLITGGNQYQGFIKSVDRQKLEVFLKEVFRGKKFLTTPSFPQGKVSFDQ
jgi:tetratricopeptide (TPR) repeat protein